MTTPGTPLPAPPRLTAPEEYAGHTRIRTQALNTIARVVAAEVFNVPVNRIKVELRDEFGSLAFTLSLPLPMRKLGQGTVPMRASLWETARDSRADVRDRFTSLTGSQVSRVDVRVTGVLLKEGRSGS